MITEAKLMCTDMFPQNPTGTYARFKMKEVGRTLLMSSVESSHTGRQAAYDA